MKIRAKQILRQLNDFIVELPILVKQCATSRSGIGLWVVITFCLSAVLLSSCGGGSTTKPVDLTTAAEYTAQGWSKFSLADYAAATELFNKAIAKDASYGQAYTGLGWTELVTSEVADEMALAVSHFSSAASNGDHSADRHAGMAASYLGRGETREDYQSAITHAQTVLDLDPDFSFSYDTNFDADQVQLVLAFASVALGEYTQALSAADKVISSGLVSNDPSTWHIEGTTYRSFVQAILAHLDALSASPRKQPK